MLAVKKKSMVRKNMDKKKNRDVDDRNGQLHDRVVGLVVISFRLYLTLIVY